jgi:hypothetical protein
MASLLPIHRFLGMLGKGRVTVAIADFAIFARLDRRV